jgi:hypothetical protein
MTFEVEETVTLEQELRELEQNASAPTSKAIRAALIKAADKLMDLSKERALQAQELEIAASLKIGAMDSQSKVDEITQQQGLTMRSVAAQLRQPL